MTLSNNQVTKLGDRLRGNASSDEDLVMLDKFRQTFSEVDELAYRVIQDVLSEQSHVTLTKRKRKTQQSIVDKLRRQSNLRLPQMQDIAGCRIVAEGGSEFVKKIESVLTGAFDQSGWQVESKDRDDHGYRAIHTIVKKGAKFYEIQLRTYAQDIWANLVESMSDEGNTLKYGGTATEQPLMKKLKLLADEFSKIDLSSHRVSLENYQHQIEEAIRHVLSH